MVLTKALIRTFTPGFDAARSADKTEFSELGTQTLTITLTLREGTEQFGIVIHADENDLVNPMITSPTNGDGIELKREGHSLHIDPKGLALNTTWTITVTIQVTPKVPEVEYDLGENTREWKVLLRKELADYPDIVINEEKQRLTAERESLLQAKAKIEAELAALRRLTQRRSRQH